MPPSRNDSDQKQHRAQLIWTAVVALALGAVALMEAATPGPALLSHSASLIDPHEPRLSAQIEGSIEGADKILRSPGSQK